MAIFDILGKISKMVEANINELLNKCGNDEAMLNQVLVDYRKTIAEVKKDVLKVNADYEMAKEREKEQQKVVDDATSAAENALKAGKEDIARQILESLGPKEDLLNTYKKQTEVCKAASEKRTADYNKLVSDLSAVEQRVNQAKCELNMANSQKKMNQAINIKNNAAAVEDTLARYEEKAQRALAEATAEAKLDAGVGTTDDLIRQYANGSPSNVDQRLAAMKEKLGI